MTGIDGMDEAGSSRRIVLPRLLRRPFRALLRMLNHGIAIPPRVMVATGAVILVGGSVAGFVAGGHADNLIARVSAEAGFRISDIRIEGVREISRIDVLTNIDLGPERSLFSFDAHKAREELKRLSWVHDVTVMKSYPASLVINIVERTPFAIWQNGQALFVVARDGAEIVPFDERFAGLPLVVGTGAAPLAAELIAAVTRYPELSGMVKAHVRVGDRRWNLELADGVTVMLPEFDMVDGLTELARLVREDAILGRAIVAIDLRLPDRTVVQLTPEAAKARREAIDQQIRQAANRDKQT